MSQYYGRPPRRSTGLILGLLFAGVLLAAGVGLAIRADRVRNESDHAVEILAAQNLVKSRFDLSTQFHQEDVTFDALPDGKVRINGTVDALTLDGHSGRFSYTVVMHYVTDTGWVGDDLSIIPI
jgi:hypothetical protein